MPESRIPRDDDRPSPDPAVLRERAERAERSGTRVKPGNGREYHIFFTADDGKGGTCSNEVRVGVPMTVGGVAGDDGPLYDSATGGQCVVPAGQ